ncbi:MAG: cupin domain-containing protein [Bryobacteraceae bacterium]|nr:cupin domain-containing protein [Bryobacteraceae bacterium]
MMGIRCVVTGHDSSGKAVFASDGEVEPISVSLLPGTEFYRLWGADQPCRFPDDGLKPSAPGYFPPVGGFRFGLFTLAPDGASIPDDLDMEAAISELNETLPGLGEPLEPDHPGMHTTATIDYEYIVSGRCVLELDDGATRELGPGDTVIQNGTRHSWRNPFREPCVIVYALVGAHHAKVSHG